MQARGSLYELETQIELAGDLEYFEDAEVTPLLKACDELGRILNGLINSDSEVDQSPAPCFLPPASCLLPPDIISSALKERRVIRARGGVFAEVVELADTPS